MQNTRDHGIAERVCNYYLHGKREYLYWHHWLLQWESQFGDQVGARNFDTFYRIKCCRNTLYGGKSMAANSPPSSSGDCIPKYFVIIQTNTDIFYY